MSLIKVFTYLFFFLFPLGQIFRLRLGSNIAVNPLDIVILILFFLLLSKAKERTGLLLKSNFIKFQLIFLLVGCVSLLLNFYFFQDINLLTASLHMIRYLACISLIMLASFTERNFNINKAIFLSGTAFLFLGFIQYFFFYDLGPYTSLGWDNHLYRLFSTFLDPNFAGIFYVCFFIFLIYNISKNSLSKSYFHIFIAFFTFVAIYVTYSRTAFLALLAGILSIMILKRKFKEILLVLIVLLGFLLLFTDARIEGSNPFRMVSSQNRLDSLKDAFTIIEKNPYFGTGFNAYRYAQLRYSTRETVGSMKSNADAGSDNSLIFVFATVGILGFAPFVASYFFLYKELFYEQAEFGIFLIGILVSLLIGGFFVNALFYTPIISWVFLVIGFRKNIIEADK